MSIQAAARSGEPKLLTKEGGRWLWTGGYDTRHLPKDAGFRWDAINKCWWTDSAERAGKLIRYATDSVRAELKGKAEDMVATLEASRATDAQIDVPVPEGLALFPFQRAGVAFVLRKLSQPAGRVILGDEMGCVDGAAIVAVNRAGKGFRLTLRDLYLRFHGMAPRGGNLWNPEIPTYCRALCDGELRQHRVVNVLDKGVRETVRVVLASGKSVCLTPDHEVATPFGFRPAETLRAGHQVLTNGQPACSRCGTTEELVTYQYARFRGLCRKCAYRSRSHPRRKGRTIDTDGYARVCGHQEHPRANKGGQIYEHVLLIERHLGRPLDWPREQVHHLNGDRADNRLENLIIVNPSDHHRAHSKHRHMDGGKGGRGGLVRFIPVVDQVVNIESAGPRRVYDVVMEDPHRNFVADGVVVHNCGKTPQAICSVNALPVIRSVLVICPASLKLNWLREWKRWTTRDLSASIATAQVCADTDVVIVNYDCFSRRSKTAEALKARQFDLMILDECFPWETLIETNLGPLPIGRIVDERLPVFVLACDSSSYDIAYMPVSRYVCRMAAGKLVRIVHERGSFVCTANHRIHVEGKGYVEADKIQHGEELRALQQDISDAQKGQIDGALLFAPMHCGSGESESRRQSEDQQGKSQAANRVGMSTVLQDVLDQTPGIWPADAPLLRQLVCSEMAHESTGETRSDSQDAGSWNQSIARPAESTGIGEDEAPQFRSGISRQSGSFIEVAERPFIHRSARGQREYHSTTGCAAPSTGMASQLDGIRDSNGCGRRSRALPADLLSRGPGISQAETGRGGGRPVAQNEATEIHRPAEGTRLVLSRVDRVEILELRSGSGSRPGAVYNLEVDGFHSYFAAGVLVSNCHALKNPKAARTREILGYWRQSPKGKVPGVQATHVLVLSGTPIVNRPVELWPILSYLDPQMWRSWKYFVERFCAGFQDGWGWKVDGASNLDELQRRMRSTLLIRRRKDEVLTELPAKTRQVVEISMDDMDDDVREAVEIEAREWDRRTAHIADLRKEVAAAEHGTAAYEDAVARLNDAVRVAFAEISKLRHATAVAKVPAVVEHLRGVLEDGDAPVVVFAHHHDAIDGIKAGLEPDHSVVVLTGRETQEEKQAAVDAFQAGQARVFIGSITAAGVGLTLTASSHVVFAELDWVPGNITQAEDRLHRIGQRSAVLVQHVVLDGSLDARMAKTLIAKQAVLDATLDSPVPAEAGSTAGDGPEQPLGPVRDPESVRRLREWLPKVLWPDYGLSDGPTAPETGRASGTADTVEGKPQAGQDRPGTPQEAPALTPEQVAAVHAGLRLLAQLDPDGARDRNDMGFNGRDVEIGHSLAEAPRLSQKQAILGRKILRKYRKTQLPPEIVAAIGYEEETT